MTCHTSVSLEDGDGTSGVGLTAAAAVSAASARAWANAISQQQRRRSSQANIPLHFGDNERSRLITGSGSDAEVFQQSVCAAGDSETKPLRSGKAGFKLIASVNRGASGMFRLIISSYTGILELMTCYFFIVHFSTPCDILSWARASYPLPLSDFVIILVIFL